MTNVLTLNRNVALRRDLPEDDLEGPVLAHVGQCDGTWQQLTSAQQAEWRGWLVEVGADPDGTCCLTIYTQPRLRARIHELDEFRRIITGTDDILRRTTWIDLLP